MDLKMVDFDGSVEIEINHRHFNKILKNKLIIFIKYYQLNVLYYFLLSPTLSNLAFDKVL